MNLRYPLILASKSPRRQELLHQAGFSFQVKTKETDESFPADMPAEEVARYLAEKKAAAFKEELRDELLLTADTTVLVDQQVLNKPASAGEAADMLKMLSGRSHKVVSGACLLHNKQMHSFTDCTEVFFRKISEEEINYYIETYQPYDKAGSYGIQEWIGLVAIEKITGSYYTVMGLPIHLVYRHLQDYQM